MAATRALAQFVANTNAADVPDAVLHQGKRCIINLFAVALHGTQDAAASIMRDVFDAEGGRGRATVLGLARRTSLKNAALINGLLAHVDDFDDTLLPTVLHPSAPTILAALAVVEQQQASGHDFLLASVRNCRLTP